MSNIYDVAERAGVSAATVSRVFNGVKVTPEREAAVRAAAAELDYVPNRNARRLRTQRSEIITMMIPDIENPFFTAMTRAVEEVARRAGFSIMLCNTDGDLERERDYLRVAVSEPVAGIILAPANDSASLDVALSRGMPVVCVDRSAPHDEVDSVVVDNREGAREATLRLFARGFGRVACISGPHRVETADQRALGWADAVHEVTGGEPDPGLVCRVPWTVEGGVDAAESLLSLPEPPDAIFAANNKVAVGALRTLADRDLMPPQCGLLAFGELPLLTHHPRGVEVVPLPATELGECAATMLLERLNGSVEPVRRIVVPTSAGLPG